MELTNNVVLLTGGSSGIGEALANSLLERDNQIIICSKHKSEAIQELEKTGNLRHFTCDLRIEADIIQVFNILRDEKLHFNILINNAGIIDEFNFFENEIKYDTLHDIVSVNLIAPMMLTHLFLKQLPDLIECCIINIGSKKALNPDPSLLAYSASKAGFHSFSLSLREQLMPLGIKVFEVVPPRVDTEMSRKVAKNRGRSITYGTMTPNECAEGILGAVESDFYEFKIQ
jgi:uncharacterized oxidoreductase